MKKVIIILLGLVFFACAYSCYEPHYVAKVQFRKTFFRAEDSTTLAWVTILEDKELNKTTAEISEDKKRANLPILSKNYEIGKVYYAYERENNFVLQETPAKMGFWFWFWSILTVIMFSLIASISKKT